jgi:hypothetical protein
MKYYEIILYSKSSLCIVIYIFLNFRLYIVVAIFQLKWNNILSLLVKYIYFILIETLFITLPPAGFVKV